MKQNIRLITMAIALLSIIACGNSNSNSEKETSKEPQKKDCKNVKWSYEKGEASPQHWADLCDGFSACDGTTQSPINIVTKDVVKDEVLPPLEFHYQTTKVDILNNGHTIQFNIDNPNNKLFIGDKDYQLLQFHYHSLSEHTINGMHAPLEVHFVHKHSDTDFAVIGVMFEEGNENPLLKNYLRHFPLKKEAYQADAVIELLKLLPENKSYYNYRGSLTTPPCSEVVNWYVLNQTLQASKEQLTAFSDILHNNYRPVMPLNGRKVEAYIQK